MLSCSPLQSMNAIVILLIGDAAHCAQYTLHFTCTRCVAVSLTAHFSVPPFIINKVHLATKIKNHFKMGLSGREAAARRRKYGIWNMKYEVWNVWNNMEWGKCENDKICKIWKVTSRAKRAKRVKRAMLRVRDSRLSGRDKFAKNIKKYYYACKMLQSDEKSKLQNVHFTLFILSFWQVIKCNFSCPWIMVSCHSAALSLFCVS